ncbi:MAG: hypothetical protein AAFO29_12880, partial [Actinomycetota bacterium]
MSVVGRGRLVLIVAWLVASATQLVLPNVAGGDRPIGSPTLLFWVVVVAASGCVVASSLVIGRAWAEDMAEVGLHGAFFMGISLLPLVHGLTTPGILYGDNQATMSSVLWAIPISGLTAAPLLVTDRRINVVLRRWRVWVIGCVGVQLLIAVLLLLWPSVLPAPDMGSAPARLIASVGLVPVIGLSFRHLRLYEIGRHTGSLVVSIAYVGAGVASLVWIGDRPMTIGFWLAHALDIAAVFAATITAFVTYRRGTLDRVVLAPLVAREPLEALELGLDPTIRRFLAD